ncbi:hypothetical protein [Paraburkholderia sp. J76]|uniref:hypothetical protein n=1 Tax=Paraburkholderia sp. J76 TaxID=2805439 RepID=UPI002ABE940D|nr:hypothetical protein [Paraburkholderia sp. J76]
MEIVQQVVCLLRSAADHRRLVTYQELHSLFGKNTPRSERYRVLELAIATLGQPREVDYGALLSLHNGLPGDEFFARFKGLRRCEYDAVMGMGTCGRSVTRRRVLASTERARVFSHAQERRRRLTPVEQNAP